MIDERDAQKSFQDPLNDKRRDLYCLPWKLSQSIGMNPGMIWQKIRVRNAHESRIPRICTINKFHLFCKYIDENIRFYIKEWN